MIWCESKHQMQNIMSRHFLLTIKNIYTHQELYKARSVVRGHTDTKKSFMIHSLLTHWQESIIGLTATSVKPEMDEIVHQVQ